MADIAAGQPIFVPSTATNPTKTIPARAHNRSDAVNNVFNTCSWRDRNRAMLV